MVYKPTRGTAAAWATSSTVLAEGQLGLARNADGTVELRFGDGTHTWPNLARSAGEMLTVLAPRATGSDQTAALNSAIASAATFGLWLALNGDHVITGQLTPVSGSRIDGTRGTVRQNGSLLGAFRLNSVSNVHIRDVVAYGKTADYVNNGSVFAAAGVYINSSSDVRVENCRLLGWAGAGVFISASCSDIHVVGCKMTGAGSGYILGTSYSNSAGIFADTGSSNWEAHRNDISGFAQGIDTGDNLTNVRVTNNFIHDIPGQHGIYCGTVNSAIISHNLIRSTGLLGMKIQVGATSVSDSDLVTVSDNVFASVGGQAILLTNPVGGSPRTRRVNVTGNVIVGAGSRAIEADNCVGVHIADNVIYNAVQGISIKNSSLIDVSHNRINTCTQNGITVTDCQDAAIDSNRIANPASDDNADAEYGISILGSTSADLTLRHNKITDGASHMRYGIFVQEGDLTTMDFIDNRVSGATDYGYRGLSANARTFRGNVFAGTSGAMLTAPSNFTAIADTSGATLTALEAEVNKLKALARSAGLIP